MLKVCETCGSLTLWWLCAAAQADAENGRAMGDAGRRMARAADSTWSGKQVRDAGTERQSTPRGAACNTGPKRKVTQRQPRHGTPGDRDGWSKDDGTGKGGRTGVASEAFFGCLKAGRMA